MEYITNQNTQLSNTQMSKQRSWLGTYNNPADGIIVQDWLENFFKKSGAVYLNGQLEQGEQGTRHI